MPQARHIHLVQATLGHASVATTGRYYTRGPQTARRGTWLCDCYSRVLRSIERRSSLVVTLRMLGSRRGRGVEGRPETQSGSLVELGCGEGDVSGAGPGFGESRADFPTATTSGVSARRQHSS